MGKEEEEEGGGGYPNELCVIWNKEYNLTRLSTILRWVPTKFCTVHSQLLRGKSGGIPHVRFNMQSTWS